MRSYAFLVKAAWLVAASLVIAGCAGGSKGSKAGEYQGEFHDIDLYLYQLQTNQGRGGWDLYPGANVDVWAFSPEPDRSKATVPGPEIRVREKDTVRITFHTGGAPMAHTLHWHGLHVPWDQDGVPYISQLPIGQKIFGGNGEPLYVYEFQVNQSGTYWYHCHVDTAHHIDMGMYGAFIVEPADPGHDPPADVDKTLILDEWDRSHSHQNQAALLAALSKSGDPKTSANDFYATLRDYILMNQAYNDTATFLGEEARKQGTAVPGIRETRDWYPVTYAPYFAEYDTFLINGRAFPYTEPIFIKSGETLRMRFINAGEQVHAMHIHGHHFLVTHSDGYKLPAPYYKDTILIGPGERYDAYITGDNPGPWHLHDHIALNEQNDYIAPGGMSTMVCYTDGWENAKELCEEGHKLHNRGEQVTVGDLLMDQYEFLLSKDPLSTAPPPPNVRTPTTSAPAPVNSVASPTGTSSGGGWIPSVPSHVH